MTATGTNISAMLLISIRVSLPLNFSLERAKPADVDRAIDITTSVAVTINELNT